MTQSTAEECGRSAARRPRKSAIQAAHRILRARGKGGKTCFLPARLAAFSTLHTGFFALAAVDNGAAGSLYKLPWRAAAWRDGASAKPLTVCAVNHPAMSSGHVGCAGFGGFPFTFLPRRGREVKGRRSRKVPGCLTSESEERETWTAESLRAAFAIGKPFALRSWKRLRRSTFQVNTMIVTVSNHRNGQSGTSSNVVISREKFSSNLRV